jgi:pimeloyl-ACP methyl ester carboxylesterase
MRRLLVPFVAAIALLPALPVAAAQDATPVTASPTAEMPATPVGDQLAWVLAQLNGDAATLTEAELTVRFAPAFLSAFPVPLLDLLRETAAQYAPIVVTGFPFPPTATGAVAELDLATGEHAAVYLTVESAPPHRITRLDLAEAPAPATATGRRVDIGGRALHLDCTGQGSPVVVLEGGIAADWAAVQSAAAASTRVCAYDRPDSPGSRSDPTPERTAQEVVDDLRALLAAAGEAGPYVLVGHSMGGLYVQLFAYEHRDEVAGLVLVDPTHEEFAARLDEIEARVLGSPPPGAAPPPGAEETSFAQMGAARAAASFPPVPLVVLTHGQADDPSERPPGWPMEEEERIWRELHAALVRLAPGGRHVIAEGSGHDIHQEQPELVVDAIRQVVGAVRDPSTWATPVASPAATPGA